MKSVAAPIVEAQQELRTQFLRLVDALSTVSGLTELPHGQIEPVQLLEQALEVLVEHQDLERCSIFLLEEGVLRCCVGTSFAEAATPALLGQKRNPGTIFKVGEGIIGIAAQTGEVQVCQDCAAEARYKNEAGTKPRGALICAPIKNGGEIHGVLNIYHPEPFHFQHWHGNLLAMCGNVLGQMLTHQVNQEELERLISKRTRQLENALFETERLKRRYEELSTVDELTELHNRRFYFAETEAALSRAIRYDHPFCVMIMDLDHFKQVNDRFGHPSGDRVLRRMADILKPFIRDGDILARLGGEEFVITLPNTETGGAIRLAERIRENLEKTQWIEQGESFQVTVSVGITCLDGFPDTLQTDQLDVLMREADRALYYAKFNGRNQVAVYREIGQAS